MSCLDFDPLYTKIYKKYFSLTLIQALNQKNNPKQVFTEKGERVLFTIEIAMLKAQLKLLELTQQLNTFSLSILLKEILNFEVPFGRLLYCLKGCPEIHIWEPKPHSADLGQSHILAAGLPAKRLAILADDILRV